MIRIITALNTHLQSFATARSLPLDTGNESFVPPLAAHLRSQTEDKAAPASLGPGALPGMTAFTPLM